MSKKETVSQEMVHFAGSLHSVNGITEVPTAKLEEWIKKLNALPPVHGPMDITELTRWLNYYESVKEKLVL